MAIDKTILELPLEVRAEMAFMSVVEKAVDECGRSGLVLHLA